MTDEAEPTGIGEAIAHAEAGSFFRWFHLETDPDAPQATGPAWRLYRPSGESFHDLVQLAVRVDGEGRIVGACLGVDRDFIRRASIRPFARDIVGSFLHWILPAEASAALGAPIDAIGQFGDGESVVVRGASAPAWSWRRLWNGRDENDIVKAFSGEDARAEQQVGPTRVTFENLIEPLPSEVSSERAAPCRAPGEEEPAWLRIAIVVAGAP